MAEPAAACPPSSRPFVLAATILASAMAFIDGSVVNIALPAIQSDLAAALAGLQWVINAYLLMLGALILVGGGLGDRLGRRRVFIAGIGLFTIASVACALAPGLWFLVAARILQGVGAALLVPQSLAIIAANFPKDIRGRAIGTWAAASSVTTALGPPVGGFLIDLLSWRAAFWINLPIAAAALWLTWAHVPESRDEEASGAVDWLGALLATIGFGALTYGFIGLSDAGTERAAALGAILAGCLLIALFVAFERRAANAVMPPELFRSPVFAGANIVTVFLYGALSGALFLLPFDLMSRRGLDAAEAGLTLLPVGLIIGFLSRPVGGLADRIGPRPFMILGPAVVGLACLGLAVGEGSLWLGVVAPLIVLSLGMAIVVSPLTTAVMNAVPDRKTGAASGVNNAASRLAGVLAVAILGAAATLIYGRAAPDGAPVFGVLPAAGSAGRTAVEAAFLAGYRTALLIGAAWSFAAALAAWLTIPAKVPTEAPPSPGGASPLPGGERSDRARSGRSG